MPYNHDAENIEPVWEQTGPDEDLRQRLSAHIRVAGLDMHLEAIEVERFNGFNIPKWDAFETQIDQLEEANGCCFSTTEIDGRTYVIIATPFGE